MNIPVIIAELVIMCDCHVRNCWRIYLGNDTEKENFGYEMIGK
jgi:hypothetical protein